MHDVAWRGMWICVRSKDAQKQLARTSLRGGHFMTYYTNGKCYGRHWFNIWSTAAGYGKYLEWIIIIINNYSPKWRWIVVDICRADTEVNNCFSIYHTSWITSGPKSNFIWDNIPIKAILFFFGCSEVNSNWLITSELANQRTRKVLFTGVLYTNNIIQHWKL